MRTKEEVQPHPHEEPALRGLRCALRVAETRLRRSTRAVRCQETAGRLGPVRRSLRFLRGGLWRRS